MPLAVTRTPLLQQALGRSPVDGTPLATTDPWPTYLEYFLDSSWVEHLRQHERVTEDERALQERILSLIADPDRRPQVRHFVGGAPGLPLRQPETPGEKETT